MSSGNPNGMSWAARAAGSSAGSQRGRARSRVTDGSSTTSAVSSAASNSEEGSVSVPLQKQNTAATTVTSNTPRPVVEENKAAILPAKSVWASRNRLLNCSVEDSKGGENATQSGNSSPEEVKTPASINGTTTAAITTVTAGVSSLAVKSSPTKKGAEQTYLKEVGGSSKLSMITPAEPDLRTQRPLRPTRPSKEASLKPSGEKMAVFANHFSVNLSGIPEKVYHYDVVIAPKESKEKEAIRLSKDEPEFEESTVPDRLLPVVWTEFEKRYNTRLGARMPFDGKKNCYSCRPLKLGPSNVWSDEFSMTDPDDDDKRRTFKIQLKLANEVNTSSVWTFLKSSDTWDRCDLPQDVIQALDVALRYCPSLQFTPCNRSFYSAEGPYPISDLLELWFGHNQSLLLGRDGRATLNIDMANKAFIKRLPVERLMKMILRKEEKDMTVNLWNDRHYKEAESFIKGKLIQYGTGKKLKDGTYEKRHRFIAVKVVSSTSSYSFKIDGKPVSIREHFIQKDIHLKHPDWPCVHVGNKNMTNYVPIELCEIVPQAYKGKLEAEDTSTMIKGAATEPRERFQRIKKSRDQCKFEQCPILKEFKLQVDNKLVQINDARKLPRPDINFKNDRGVIVSLKPPTDEGKFQIGQFLKAAVVPKVGVINASGKRNIGNIKDFLVKLAKEADARGMRGEGGVSVREVFDKAEQKDVMARVVKGSVTFNIKVSQLLEEFKMKGCELIMVVMSKDGNEYSVIKNEAEVQVGILTQCVKENTVAKIAKSPDQQVKQITTNILLKINAKLNGINFELGPATQNMFRLQSEHTLILGADVTHPAPHSRSPSIAAVTASFDLSGTCFQMHIQIQQSTQEVIENMHQILPEMLKGFRTKTGKVPKRIIMFRDGVSEGQFNEIKKVEFAGIQKACRIVSPGYQPKITFVVVKKRHHTRFMNVEPRMSVRPKNNIPPGTVVDTIITHPTEMEYFLNSHVGIQGTSKPTRYHVIHDDIGFTMDEIEQLTNCLCYTFVRCTHPVSYPAPTYYAHLAAFRARALMEREGTESVSLDELIERMTIKPELAKKYPMFYV